MSFMIAFNKPNTAERERIKPYANQNPLSPNYEGPVMTSGIGPEVVVVVPGPRQPSSEKPGLEGSF